MRVSYWSSCTLLTLIVFSIVAANGSLKDNDYLTPSGLEDDEDFDVGSEKGEIVSVSGSGSASGEMSSSGAGSDEESSTTIPLPEFEMTDERNKSFTGIVVDIVARNEVADDIVLPPLPFYRLATSITFFCHVYGASGHVKYRWFTTSASNFTSNSTSVFNRRTVLTSADAGVYTCSASDSDGNIGQASIEIKFNGAEIYIVQSHNYNSRLVTNNSVILQHPDSCLSNCFADILCYSNSTLLSTGEVIFPDGRAYANNYLLSSRYTVERLHSAIHLVVPNRDHSPHLNHGIFTFKIPDANGIISHLSLGLYTHYPGRPNIYASLSGYTDLTRDNSTTAMAQIECYTTNSPPTHVIWQKNGEIINTDGFMYDEIQIVTDHRNSHYRNVLLVNDLVSVVGDLTFSCNVSNVNGSASLNIPTAITSVTPTIRLTPKLEFDYEGHSVVLECSGGVNPMKTAAQLAYADRINVEWFGPDGNPLTGKPFIGDRRNSDAGTTHTLTIVETTFRHSGLYSCQVTLDLPNTDFETSHRVTTQYHLVLLKNVTVSLPDSEDEPSSQTNDIRCTWSGGEIGRMEWLFIGNNTIVPMEYTNTSWNDAEFACFAKYGEELTQPKLINLRVKATFTNDVSIVASTDRPTAGESFTLTCTVVSDRPPIMNWIGNGLSSEGIVVHSQAVSGFNSTLVIEFHPLRTSHGGIYTCVSSVSQSPSVHDSQLDFPVGVYIPEPTVMILTEPRKIDHLLSDTQLRLFCIVEYVSEVDTEVSVNATWESLETDSRTTLTEELLFHAINSTLTINPLTLSDTDVYTCTGNVLPNNESTTTVYGSSSTEELRIRVSLSVSIQVEYNPPRDFTLPSPPYYRPASSVTLRCIAKNGASPLQYHWSSTCSNCFASNSSSRHISTNILKSTDAGTHTCTVTDREGYSGYARTEMKLNGAGIYVEESQYISSTPVANNTIIKVACQSCSVAFSCYSNLTETSSSATIIPRVVVNTFVPSGIRFYYRNRYNYYGYPNSGVYTCRFSDSDGTVVDASIGVSFDYRASDIRAPYIFSSSYGDFSSSIYKASPLAVFNCSSIYSAVTWLRNGEEINTRNGYNENVWVLNRYNYRFHNSLRVYHVAGVVGNNTYTCVVNNSFGQASRSFNLDNTVSSIAASSKPFYGSNLVLKCRARHPPSGYTVDMRLEWFGPNGPIDVEKDDVVIGEQYSAIHYIQREVVFSYLTPNQNGLYTCQLSAYFEASNETLVEQNQYLLEVLSILTTNAQDNVFFYSPGHSENVICSWNGTDVQKLEWFLEGLDSLPILSETNSTSITLMPDRSTNGLDGTKFTCRATTYTGDQFEETVSVRTKDVRISISYNSPSDFSLPSPPFYRPASSVKFVCLVYGATRPVQYHWTSTATAFVQQQTSWTVTINNMDVSDVGIYTCSVTDSDGDTVSATTTIQLSGGGMYVERSRHISNQAVPNNTALILRRERHTYFRRVSFYIVRFYCFSNASDSSPTIVLPRGREYTTNSYYGVRPVQQSGIYLSFKREFHPDTGIYTCRMTDSNGHVVDMSVGIYYWSPSQLHLVRTEFRDFTGSLIRRGSAFATYTCFTNNSPPTYVSWTRDNVSLVIDDIHYGTMQVVTNQYSSSYKNILLVYDITEMLGNSTYRCLISNAGGNISGYIQGGNTVSADTRLWTSAEPTYQTQFVLTCQATIPPQYIERIAPYIAYIDIVWSGPEAVMSQLQSDASVLQETDTENLTSSLTFLALNTSHNGIYSCQTILRLSLRNLIIGQSSSIRVSLEAITVTGHEEVHIIGPPVELVCVSKDENIRRMEWISQTIGNTVLASENRTNYLALTVNTSEVENREWFICKVITSKGFQLQRRVLFTVRELIHTVAVTASSDIPVVGTNFTLSCTVTSEQPSSITWIGPNGPISNSLNNVTVTQQNIQGNHTFYTHTTDGKILRRTEVTTRSDIIFHPILLSHGHVYTCKSRVNVTSTRSSASQAYPLNVQIPPPLVNVSRETEGEIQLGSAQLLKCSVTVWKVDIPVTVTLQWSSLTSLLNESTISIPRRQGQYNNLYLTLVFDSYHFYDSGAYICTALVAPAANSSAIVQARVSSTIVLSATDALNVSIEVDYIPPPDFTLPSPPYYRPASSVNLTCVAHDIIGSVQYRWTSTEARSFAHQKNGRRIFQKLLTAYDAGVHSCTATDAWGNTGTAMTEMSLFGMGIYVEKSQYIVNSSIANNTELRLTNKYCRIHCKRLSFSCFSNMTNITLITSYPVLRERNRYNGYYRDVDPWQKNNLVSQSGIRMYVSSSRSDDVAQGTYSCEIASNSSVETRQKMTIGVYSRYAKASIYRRYWDVTDDNSTTKLAVVTCKSRYIQPQNVSWLRNGHFLQIDGHSYETVQILENQMRSEYDNNLVIRDAIGLLNSPIYTCRISNNIATLVLNIPITIDISVSCMFSKHPVSDWEVTFTMATNEGYSVVNYVAVVKGASTQCLTEQATEMTIKRVKTTLTFFQFTKMQIAVEINAPSKPAAYGDNYTLTCQTHTVETKPTLTNPLLQRYLRVDWLDINNNHVTGLDSFTVGELSSEFSRTLYFNPLSEGHDRLYVCVATLDLPGAQVNSTSGYRIKLESALLQLKFDSIPCTFLSEHQSFAVNLENTIKDTLTDVINKKCNCNFLNEMIVEGEFSCIKSRSISYRAQIEGSSDVQSAELMVDTLQTWKRSYGTVLFSSSFNLRLWVDPFCPLEIHSLQAPLCRV